MALNMVRQHRVLWYGGGILCLLGGLSVAYVQQTFSLVPVVCGALGLGAFMLCWVGVSVSARRPARTHIWKTYGWVTVVVLVGLCIFVGVNVAAHRFSLRWDVTQARQHTLSPSTRGLIDALAQDVKFTAFYVGLPPKYLEDLFREYARHSNGRVTTEIVDPVLQIGYAAQFGPKIDTQQQKVIVQSQTGPTARRDVDFTSQRLTEGALNNALIQVTRSARQAYFLTGHSEYQIVDDRDTGLSALARMLVANNVESHSLMLGTAEGIPDVCDVLIIAGPRQLLTAREDRLIQEYLAQGGDALFLIEHTLVTTPEQPLTEEEQQRNPSLNGLLNAWGIHVAHDIVVDLNSHVGADVGSPATRNYAPHQALTQDLDYTFYVRPRSITFLEERRSSIQVAPVVFTESQEQSWGETDRTLSVQFDETVDTSGPVPIGAVVFEAHAGETPSETRIMVFTDADFLSNVFISRYSNASMGLNAINWLTESTDQVFIDERVLNVERLDLTSQQQRLVAVVLVVIPLLIALSGVLLWVKQAG